MSIMRGGRQAHPRIPIQQESVIVDWSGEHMKPTIIIGLGGTGCAVVDNVHAHLTADTAMAHAEGESIRFIIADTDVKALIESRLTRDSMLHLGGFSIHQYVSRLCAEDPHFQEWWDCAIHTRINTVDYGSGIVRRNGRLGLYRHFEAVRRIIDTNLRACRRDDSIDDSGLVIITGSLCGGTGSALLIDFACVARHYAGAIGVRCETVGVFALPAIYTRFAPSQHHHDILLANGYATLAEMRAIEGGNSPFNGVYAFGAQRCRLTESIPRGVFDSYRLLADRDGKGYVWKEMKDYFSLMADEIVRIVHGDAAAPSPTTAFANVGRICEYAPKDLRHWKSCYDNIMNSPNSLDVHADKRYGNRTTRDQID